MMAPRSSEKEIYFTPLYKNATVTGSKLFFNPFFTKKTKKKLQHYSESPLNDSRSAYPDSKSVFSNFLFLLQ